MHGHAMLHNINTITMRKEWTRVGAMAMVVYPYIIQSNLCSDLFSTLFSYSAHIIYFYYQKYIRSLNTYHITSNVHQNLNFLNLNGSYIRSSHISSV